MTRVKILRKDGRITALTADGHTDFGEEGEDVVCAALSSVIQTAVLGLLKVAAIPLEYKILDQSGSLEFKVPDNLSEGDRKAADIILETMLCGIADLHEGFSKYIKLEV
ncbi:MAG: ribosomal-processing cysteine protease Prp [Clostridiales bacterium]|jgi:uncharacterized protein YsxB (DUF464 family)|nr:ribosomal-processing cysteine protease Prp [Clostridiales bacterium]